MEAAQKSAGKIKQRPYLYYDSTVSLCAICHRRVDAKIIFEDEKVILVKRCPEHGKQKVLLATDIEYFKKSREFVKKSEMPRRFNTAVKLGCPHDCGLCEDHEQHSCLTVLEITDHCNLKCPVCYCSSEPGLAHRDLKTIGFMLDNILENEGIADVVQISGGEPTTHPQFFEIMDMAKNSSIRHLMLNTNGVRIANEAGFAEKLARYMPGFEVYLQFDSLQPEALVTLRGKDLSETRLKALEKLNSLNISTTLVVALKRGVNDLEIGEILNFAAKQKCVRGVTFQPVQEAGRLPAGQNGAKLMGEKLTVSEIREQIIRQSGLFSSADLLPVPCHPDSLCMGYALKINDKILPLTRFVDPSVLLNGAGNTVSFEHKDHLMNEKNNLNGELKKIFYSLYSTGCSPDDSAKGLHDLLCCLPKIDAPGLTYDNVFRVIIMRFMDAHDFDLRSIKKSCVHIAHPDGRIIPFDTMNLFYRDPQI